MLWPYKPLGYPESLGIHVIARACGNTPVSTLLHWDQLALKFQSCSPAVWTQCTLEGYSLRTATERDRQRREERDRFVETHHWNQEDTHIHTNTQPSLQTSPYTSLFLYPGPGLWIWVSHMWGAADKFQYVTYSKPFAAEIYSIKTLYCKTLSLSLLSVSVKTNTSTATRTWVH